MFGKRGWSKPVTNKLRKKNALNRFSTGTDIFPSSTNEGTAAAQDSWSGALSVSRNRRPLSEGFGLADWNVGSSRNRHTLPPLHFDSDSRSSSWSFLDIGVPDEYDNGSQSNFQQPDYVRGERNEIERFDSGADPVVVVDRGCPSCQNGRSITASYTEQTGAQIEQAHHQRESNFAGYPEQTITRLDKHDVHGPHDSGHESVTLHEHDEQATPAHAILPEERHGAQVALASGFLTLDLSQIEEHLRQLKASQRRLRSDSRSHFDDYEKQFSDLQYERREVEASWDVVEEHIDEHKDDRARALEEDSSIKRRLEDVEKYRKRLSMLEEEENQEEAVDEELFADVNARDRAIVNSLGRRAQRQRSIQTPGALYTIHEQTPYGEHKYFPGHPLPFVRDDYLVYIREDFHQIRDRNGYHIGWNHQQIPSYKRRQTVYHRNSREEALMEIGKRPVSERMEALYRCRMFSQTLDQEKKEKQVRMVAPRWYDERTMTELLGKRLERVEDENRHDSVAYEP